MENKKILIENISKMSQRLLKLSVLFENMRRSLNQRKEELTLKELKEYCNICIKAELNILNKLKEIKK